MRNSATHLIQCKKLFLVADSLLVHFKSARHLMDAPIELTDLIAAFLRFGEFGFGLDLCLEITLGNFFDTMLQLPNGLGDAFDHPDD